MDGKQLKHASSSGIAEQKIKKFLISKIRLAWRYYSPERKACLKAGECVKCKKKTKELYADHIFPVVDVKKGFEGWDTYFRRMFYGKLQALCKVCHDSKTREERRERWKCKRK